MNDELPEDRVENGVEHVKRRRVFKLPHLTIEFKEVEVPPHTTDVPRTRSVWARIVPWVFGAAFAALLFVLGIHRTSWEYPVIILGIVAVAFVVTGGRRR